MSEFKIAFLGNGEAVMQRNILWILFDCQTEKSSSTAQETKALARSEAGENIERQIKTGGLNGLKMLRHFRATYK